MVSFNLWILDLNIFFSFIGSLYKEFIKIKCEEGDSQGISLASFGRWLDLGGAEDGEPSVMIFVS